MALATVQVLSDVNAQFVAPASVLCDWQQIGTDLYLNVFDGATNGAAIINPDGEIDDASRRIIKRDNRMGTLLGVRMAYNSGLTSITSPIIKVFGCVIDTVTAAAGPWQILKNRLGDLAVPLTVATSDIKENAGSPFYTTPDPEGHYFDTQGCNAFLIGVEVKIAATEQVTKAALQVKII